jgi:hypothetical protein
MATYLSTSSPHGLLPRSAYLAAYFTGIPNETLEMTSPFSDKPRVARSSIIFSSVSANQSPSLPSVSRFDLSFGLPGLMSEPNYPATLVGSCHEVIWFPLKLRVRILCQIKMFDI